MRAVERRRRVRDRYDFRAAKSVPDRRRRPATCAAGRRRERDSGISRNAPPSAVRTGRAANHGIRRGPARGRFGVGGTDRRVTGDLAMQVGRTGPLPARRATRSRRYGTLMPIADARRRTARRLPASSVIVVASPWRFGARQRSSMPPRISVPPSASGAAPADAAAIGMELPAHGRCLDAGANGERMTVGGLRTAGDAHTRRTHGDRLAMRKDPADPVIADVRAARRRHAMRRSGSDPSQWAGNTWKRPATGTPSPACTGSCQTPPAGRRCGDAVAASTEPVRRTALSCAMQDRALPERRREFRFT